MSQPLFTDYISLRQYQVERDRRNQFLDTILSSIERQKDEVSGDTIQGLQVKARVTHAARLTGHWHYYAPYFVKNGKDSFTNPYEKPALIHHEDKKDPIGRVKRASYIETPHPMIPQSLYDQIINTSEHNKKTLQYIKKIKPFLYDKRFEGLGYIQTVANITDPAAIEKIIDGRYHTISIGYGTDSLICSECFTDWVKSDVCEHIKGKSYGSGPMFLIFGDMTYDEYSYVNEPADSIAANEEIKKFAIQVNMSLADNLQKAKSTFERSSLVVAAVAQDSLLITNPENTPVSDLQLYYYDNNNDTFISQDTEYKNNGDISGMKLQDLYALDAQELHAKITESVSEDQRLAFEEIKKLEDKMFLGRGRNFPVPNDAYIAAVKQLIETVEDCEEKTELLGFIAERTPTSTDNTNTNTSVTENTDEVYYSFSISASGWKQPEGPDAEKEKAILELLLSLYAKGGDALPIINKILELNSDTKDNIVAELNKDQITEFEGRINNYKKEFDLWKDNETSLNNLVAEMTDELKENYINNILSFQDKEDPKVDIEKMRDSFKSQSLVELKATYKNFSAIFNKDFVPAVVRNTTNQFVVNSEDNEVTPEQITKLEEQTEKTYLKLRTKDLRVAENFKKTQNIKIQDLKKKVKSE